MSAIPEQAIDPQSIANFQSFPGDWKSIGIQIENQNTLY